MGLGACSTELPVGSGLVDLAKPGRRANGAAGADYDWGYEATDSGLDVPDETDAESLAGAAESHQIVDAAGVAAVVSRDGDDARRVGVSNKLFFPRTTCRGSL